ncbi:hypothetical protein LPUS_02759 [Lasallia pustulata]|uniref:Uncharacterized protein n=1 Tax=Lasallia pustulata TaxID=136370 RepID=A0A1W5CTA8_9LECA|nr:hypothetical protein LPUS_02759 [Lasallia pustulata]
MVKRMPASSTTDTAAFSCAPNDKSARCQRPTSSTATLTVPIVLGVVIPVVVAITIFLFLHRRHVKKLRAEDANDKHKSLDFGIEPSMPAAAGRGKNRNRGPEMTVTDYSTEKAIRRGRGLSMDTGSPYVLPQGLQSSHESLHSLSRLQRGDDRYRPATTLFGNETPANRSDASSKKGEDASSSYTGSSGRGYRQEGVRNNLLRNAQRMPRSVPPAQRDTSMASDKIPHIQVPENIIAIPRKCVPPQQGKPGLAVTTLPESRDSYMSDAAGIRRSNNYLGAFIHSRDTSADLQTEAQSPPPLAPQTKAQSPPPLAPVSLPSSPPPIYSPGPSRGTTPPAPSTLAEVSRPPRLQSLQAPVQPLKPSFLDEASDYGDDFKVTPPSPVLEAEGQRSELPQPTRPLQRFEPLPRSEPLQRFEPLPRSEPLQRFEPLQPSEPQQRFKDAPMLAANGQTRGHLEINDLGYDARRLSMGVRPLPPDDPSDNPEQRANRIRSFYKEYFDESKRVPAQASGGYYEDYSQDYLGDAPAFDAVAGQYVVGIAQPYAEPVDRRAMTPPPRAPPRFQGGRRHQAATSSTSSPRFMSPGPRAYSSASAPFGPPGRGPPRKTKPPPAPLRMLPTPHLLQEDSFALPMDFAPPTSYRDRRAGTPTSPRGGMLPYSPSLPAHMPLVSSFQDLAVMPSPHALRKSGTFTALDFAPPPRFKSGDTASDSGSIRSNRSAMSGAQLNNIRSGAYRVSRIPKEVVFSKNEIAETLKPTWNQRS